MQFKEIKKNVFYCGLNDEDRKFFDELIPLDKGTSYNSYLVVGSEKTALIDTMYLPKTKEYLENFDKNNVKKIDYIVINHGEQDHSGALPDLIEKFPEAVILTNPTCKKNLIEMLLIPEDKIQVVQNEEELCLGDETLKFIFAPNVHWPDTMFTYLKNNNILCTCDFLGAHKVFDDIFAIADESLEKGAKKYYSEIMMPFRVICKKYIAMIKEMNVDMILPSHGPIYKKPDYILNLYEDWTKDECKNLALFPFVSMYKSSEEMVDYVIKKVAEAGIECYKFDLIRGNIGELAIKLVDAKTIVIGCSMVLAMPHPAAMNFAYLLTILKPKVKFLSIIGSYGWGGKLIEPLSCTLANLRAEILEPVLIKGKAKTQDWETLDKLAQNIINKHT